MRTDKKIQIFLSTYNGEKYLRAQLDSFIRLEGFEQIKVLIRDDGSTDTTQNILEEYRQKYGFEILHGENLGVNASMFELFANCDMECSYFALSDQDDVWLPEKFALALSCLDPLDQTQPLLFASRSKIVSETLEPLGATISPTCGASFYNAMVQNITPGHTQVFNLALMRLLREGNSTGVNVVDWWIYLLASGMGQVIFKDEFTVLHRQHGKNSVGYEVRPFAHFCQRLARVRKGKSSGLTIQINSFVNQYGNLLPDDFLTESTLFLTSQGNIAARVKYLACCKIYRQTVLDTFFLKILYLLGKYKL